MFYAVMIVLGLILVPMVPYFAFEKCNDYFGRYGKGAVAAKVWVLFTTFNVAFIPTWLYLLVVSCLHPEGFWQGAAAVVMGLMFLGFIQFIFFCIWVWAAFLVIVEY